MKKLATIFLILVWQYSAFGATYYVTTTGINNASEDGSINEPWATPEYASTRSAAGDTILVADGDYQHPDRRREQATEDTLGFHTFGVAEHRACQTQTIDAAVLPNGRESLSVNRIYGK